MNSYHTMDRIISSIEEIYETETIVRSCIVCDSEETLNELVTRMEANNHTVDCVAYDELNDERPNYVLKFRSFRNDARVMAMSYATWYHLKDLVEVEILPYQNLFIVVNLEDGLTNFVARSLKDSFMRGFMMKEELIQSHFFVFSINE